MSDYSITVACKQSYCPDNKQIANDILNWLISNDIVKNTNSDCCLGTNGGYAISNGAKEVTDDPDYLPFNLNINGLSITIDRTVFDTGQNGIDEIICPKCNADILEQEWSFDDWHNEINNNMTCPVCHTSNEINSFRFMPEWGFSNLGFTFWNWPSLKDGFIQDLKQKIGTDVVVVYQHI